MIIGVIGNAESWYLEAICAAAESRGHRALRLEFPQLSAQILGGKLTVTQGESSLHELDSLIVRTMPPGSLEEVVWRMDLLSGLQDHGVQIVNSPRSLECAVDKYLTTQRLAAAGLPVPNTIVCENSDVALKAFEQLGGDVVVKPLFGAEGRGILRVSHPEMALRTFRTLERLDTALYIQKFFDSPRDYRVLLLDGDVIGAMTRTPVDGEFRANAAQQGHCERWSPPESAVKMAQESARVCGCIFAGVDLMADGQGGYQVIEVNAVPGWRALQRVCEVNVADRLIAWLEVASRPDKAAKST